MSAVSSARWARLVRNWARRRSISSVGKVGFRRVSASNVRMSGKSSLRERPENPVLWAPAPYERLAPADSSSSKIFWNGRVSVPRIKPSAAKSASPIFSSESNRLPLERWPPITTDGLLKLARTITVMPFGRLTRVISSGPGKDCWRLFMHSPPPHLEGRFQRHDFAFEGISVQLFVHRQV